MQTTSEGYSGLSHKMRAGQRRHWMRAGQRRHWRIIRIRSFSPSDIWNCPDPVIDITYD